MEHMTAGKTTRVPAGRSRPTRAAVKAVVPRFVRHPYFRPKALIRADSISTLLIEEVGFKNIQKC
jgi:hypothetical protein